MFRVAEEHAPSIVFIDEIDAVGTKRYDSNSGGEREIQRTMLELLNQLDGFDSRGDVKVKNCVIYLLRTCRMFFKHVFFFKGGYGHKSYRNFRSSLDSSWSY